MRTHPRTRRSPMLAPKFAPRPLVLEPLDDRCVPTVVSVSKAYTAAPDATVTVTIDIDTTGDKASTFYFSADLGLEFDPAILTPVLNGKGELAPRPGTANPGFSVLGTVDSPGKLTFAAFSGLDAEVLQDKSLSIVEVDFKVLAGATLGATSPLNLTVATLTDSTDATVTLSTAPTKASTDAVDGLFTVQNNLPLNAADDAFPAQRGQVTVLDVLTNDDGAGRVLVAGGLGTPDKGGTVVIDGTTLKYTSAADFSGVETFTYQITDGTDTKSATVTVTVNAPPTAAADTQLVQQNSGAVTIDVLANDSFAPDTGETLTITGTPTATKGTVEVVSNKLSYTPSKDFFGTDALTYTVSDGNGGTATGTVTVTVNAVPVAVADAGTLVRGSGSVVVDVRANDTDADGTTAALVLALPSGATAKGGAVVLDGDKVKYTPAAGFLGDDTFTYTVTDANGGTATGTATITVTNAPPVAGADAVLVQQNSANNVVTVLGNDTDPDGAANKLTVTAVGTGDKGGTVTLTGGQIKYAPAKDFFGTETFQYTVSDPDGGTASGTVTVTVNAPPVAFADAATVGRNTALVVDVRANDTDADGTADALVVALPSAATAKGGAVELDAGKVKYTPAAGFAGTDTFQYTVTDANGGTATGTVTITVTNQSPVAGNDNPSFVPNSVDNLIDVLANDSDPDAATGETLTISTVGALDKGGTAVVSGGKIKYTPAADFQGTETFTYEVTDANGATATATVTVNVTPNLPPVANPDAVSIDRGTASVLIDVLANDTDPDGGAAPVLTISALATPSKGGTVVVEGGKVRYSPATGFAGVETFGYTVTDAKGGNTDGVVTVTVNNLPPVAGPDTALVQQGSTDAFITVLGNDTDPDGSPDKLTVTAVNPLGSAGGAVTVSSGKLKYTPLPTFSGQELLTYTVSDPDGGTATGTVTVTVNAVPVAAADAGTLVRGSGSVVVDVRANDTDADGTVDALVVALPSGATAKGGTVVLDGGKVKYTPAAGFLGDDTFTYTVTDANGGTGTGTATITVTNAPPVAVNDFVSVVQNAAASVVAVLGNDTDPDGAAAGLTVTAVGTGSKGGAVSLTAGQITYAPAKDFFGTETFQYTVSDPDGGTATGTVTVTVNARPVAVADAGSLVRGSGSLLVDVRANDTDADGSAAALVVALPAAKSANGGTVVLDGGKVKYTPAAGFLGKDTFTYTVTDAANLTATGTATITVTNAPPVAVNDEFFIAGGATVLDVRGNDTDPDGAAAADLTVGLPSATTAKGGTVVVTAGAVTYTPAVGFAGTDSFTYTVTDKDGGTATATATVKVNAPPVAKNDTLRVQQGGTGTVAVLANDSDPDGGTLTILAVSKSSKGATVGFSNGVLTYAAAAGFAGTDTLTYTVADGQGGTATGTVTVTVNAPPVAVADAANSNGAAVTIDVLANDTTDAGETVTLAGVGAAANGKAAVANGKVTYTPNAGFSGTDTFTYTISDGNGGTATGKVAVTVTLPEPTTPRESLVGSTQFTVGADAGRGPVVSTFDGSGKLVSSRTVFEADFTGGVRTATADMNGDGVPDTIVGTGPGRATQVKILDGKTGQELRSIAPFEASFTGGVFVAVGDITGDGKPELIITPDEGGGPRVRVFAADGTSLADFFGIDDPAFRGGARAALGDVNGDGVADLVVSAGFQGGPRIAVYDGTSVQAGKPTRLVDDFFAFEETLRNGAYVAVGDINGDGKADLVFGGGPGGGPRVRVADAAKLLAAGKFRSLDDIPDVQIANFFAGDENNRGGVRVTVKDLDGDRFGDLVVGAGTGGGDTVTAYPGSTLSTGSTDDAFALDTFDDFTGGVFVG